MKHSILILLTIIFIGSVYDVTAQEATPEVTPEATPESTAEPNGLPEFTGTVNAVFRPETENPLVGEAVDVTLLIETPIDVEITGWPLFPVTEGGVFEVLEVNEIERVEGATSIRYEQTITVILWETGNHITAEVPVVYRTIGSDIDQFSPVRSAAFNVPDMFTVTADQSLRPARPPLYMYHVPSWILGAVGVAAVVGLFGIRLLIRQRRRRETLRVMTAGTPGQMAVSLLMKLQEQDASASDIYASVSDTLRAYIQKRFQVSAQERTTGELMAMLKKDVYLPEQYYKQLQRILEEADLVKFARFEPEAYAGKRLLQVSIQWIEGVERMRARVNA